MKSIFNKLSILSILVSLCFLSCQKMQHVSSQEDRAALFDDIMEKTMAREAFSLIKNQQLGLDVEKQMMQFRDEVVAADTDEKLFNALMKLSNARKDRHLSVGLVEDGLTISQTGIKHAPVRFAVDFETQGSYFFFVSDYAKNIQSYTENSNPEIGDKLLKVNSKEIDDYFQEVEPYFRYSTINGLWWKFAEGLPMQTYRIPITLEQDDLTCVMQKKDGSQYTIKLPYLEPESIDWQGFYKGFGDFRYPGFSKIYDCQTYVLYKNEAGKKVLLLDWYGFRENLVQDMNRLVEYASKNNMLDYSIIWDGTRSRGGSKGAYALQKLTSKPFKTTFGNLRISDITEAFISDRRERFKNRNLTDSGVTETINDGSWLMDWLENDVTQAINDGQEYSNNVPFKSAHLPKHSDGILKPAEVHFTGKMVCFFGPHGGSHLDQFAAQVIDNDLAYTIGMSAGGYSNTWEWEETLVFPISQKPVVEFMWSIGHTIRPNGEILEGNPAQVDLYVPLTRDNYLDYYEILISHAFKYFGLE